jgi:antitoxin CptB
LDRDHRLRRLAFRAWHRGTKEADLLIGGFYDRYAATWSDAEIDWYETFLEEEDVDIMAWAIGTQTWPARFLGPQQEAMMRLDYIPIAR